MIFALEMCFEIKVKRLNFQIQSMDFTLHIYSIEHCKNHPRRDRYISCGLCSNQFGRDNSVAQGLRLSAHANKNMNTEILCKMTSKIEI